MKTLETAIELIRKPNETVYREAMDRLSQQVRPAGSLGILEGLSARLAGIAGQLDVKLANKVIVTCAGDHGVVAEGVSLFPQEVTSQMVTNFVDGRTSINVLADHAGAKVVVADLGVNCDFDPDLPIFHKKIRKSTSNFARVPAMSPQEAIRAVEAGIEIVDEIQQQKPINLLGTGDMGIGNTTPSTAIIAVLAGMDASELTGRGTGIDDKGLQNKKDVINNAIALHQPDKSDPIDVLAKVGGFEIGGLAGLVIGAAKHGIPVICDGLISTAGALIACGIAPGARDYLFASHRSVEVGHAFMHRHLKLEPLLDLRFRLGEGTGAALAMELLDASTRILADIKTFAEAEIENVQEQP